MSTGFSAEIFAQKLSKLNIAQQSIETLSHWCIFHHRCCQEVVDIWNKDFHSAPQERKISLLYLANDIMQNSKKDGMRYIHEFLKVIAAALDDLFTNGDDFGRNVVKRLGKKSCLWMAGQIMRFFICGDQPVNLPYNTYPLFCNWYDLSRPPSYIYKGGPR
uniref:CID domain-containing protein n=1 Tax=Triticum urartu TaxID=4572 RepID=A0A8R7PWE8_TRIUA